MLSQPGTMPETGLPGGWMTFGHRGPSRLLLQSLRAGRLSHAYLITGPEQAGRKTLALDLARAVNCRPAPDLFGNAPERPCGACVACQRIARGIHSDVRVITPDTPTREKRDGGDEGGERSRKFISIEHIRDLEHDASLKPFESGWKVFVIDGAHLMHGPTFNAFLKTLEEPPPEVLLVLVAPTAGSLPDTIVSRCHLVELRPVQPDVIHQALVSRFKARPEQASVLARQARGCPGWAINALTDETLLERRSQAVQRIVDTLTGDLEARFRYARSLGDAFWRRRGEVLAEMEAWQEWWRDVAVVQAGLESLVSNLDWLAVLKSAASDLRRDEIAAASLVVDNTSKALEANAMARLALEVMMLDLPGIRKTSATPAVAGK